MPKSHNALISDVLSVNKNAVVVLVCGSPVETPWIDGTRAVLDMYLSGEAGGEACARLLYGDANPSGKLAETFPMNGHDNPSNLYFGKGPRTVEYRESVYVGYRYYDKAKKDVRFPFGYGLSYTAFDYGNLSFDAEKLGKGDGLTVTFDITNTGSFDGAETAEIYVGDDESTAYRETKALKNFEKVFLKAGEKKTVSVKLGYGDFAFYNIETRSYEVESGDFTIYVGASSRDIRLSGKVTVNGISDNITDFSAEAPFYYEPSSYAEIPTKEFEKILGCDLVGNAPYKRGEIDENTSIGDLGTCLFGKFFMRAVYRFAPLLLPKGSGEAAKKMIRAGVLDLPLRNLYALTAGKIPKGVVDGIIMRCNSRRPFRGFGTALKALFGKKPSDKSKLYPLEQEWKQ
jgi:beta-glucosidase